MLSANISDPSKCLLWTGAINNRGYGHRTIKGKSVLAHRAAYEEAFGPIPSGLEIDHLCFNRLCVSPDHLEAVTRTENVRRQRARITHCPQGHSYDMTIYGYRACRTCRRLADKRYRANRPLLREYLREVEP